MPIRIRRADLEADKNAMIEMFRRYLLPEYDQKRFDWLYHQAPHGKAMAWLACDSDTNAIVGAAAAFPRKMFFAGNEKTGFVLGDFCMDEKYRSLGPSLQLQRACVAAIASGPAEFLYDFPSAGMLAIYQRMGIPQTGSMGRWAKPLRVDSKLAAVIHSKTLAKGIGFVANAALLQRGWKGEKKAAEITLQQGPCGEEFTELDRQLASQPGIRTVRSAGYLNWRYFSQGAPGHEMLIARRKGALIGYTIYTKDPEDANIVELGSIENFSVIAGLLAAAVKRLWDLGASTANLNAGETHPWNEVFQRAGFRKRQSAPVVVHARAGSSVSANDFQHHWYLMRGERDC